VDVDPLLGESSKSESKTPKIANLQGKLALDPTKMMVGNLPPKKDPLRDSLDNQKTPATETLDSSTDTETVSKPLTSLTKDRPANKKKRDLQPFVVQRNRL